MPHAVVDYSSNLKDRVDFPAFTDHLHQAMVDTGIFPLGGTRVRLFESQTYKIADGHPDNAYIHVELRIGHGRNQETKKKAADAIFDRITNFLKDDFKKNRLAISMNVSELDEYFNYKQNNLHQYLKSTK